MWRNLMLCILMFSSLAGWPSEVSLQKPSVKTHDCSAIALQGWRHTHTHTHLTHLKRHGAVTTLRLMTLPWPLRMATQGTRRAARLHGLKPRVIPFNPMQTPLSGSHLYLACQLDLRVAKPTFSYYRMSGVTRRQAHAARSPHGASLAFLALALILSRPPFSTPPAPFLLYLLYSTFPASFYTPCIPYPCLSSSQTSCPLFPPSCTLFFIFTPPQLPSKAYDTIGMAQRRYA
eukprot:555972-Pelagomonas_calceolata.AAC.5